MKRSLIIDNTENVAVKRQPGRQYQARKISLKNKIFRCFLGVVVALMMVPANVFAMANPLIASIDPWATLTEAFGAVNESLNGNSQAQDSQTAVPGRAIVCVKGGAAALFGSNDASLNSTNNNNSASVADTLMTLDQGQATQTDIVNQDTANLDSAVEQDSADATD